jgi:cation-transporting P-type ATPase C
VLDISRETMRVIRQNYAISVGVNAAGLVFAAAGSINPIFAAVLHNASTLLVVLNSSRLIRYEPRTTFPRMPSALLAGAAIQQERHRDTSTERTRAERDRLEQQAAQFGGDQGTDRPGM